MGCNCGSGAPCTCVLRAGSGIVISGTGSVADPYVLTAPVDCNNTMDCVASHARDGFRYDPAAHDLYVAYSAQSGNMAKAGTDGGVYVAPPLSGPGVSYDPATRLLAIRFSTQAGNVATTGQDGQLYVPAPGAPGSMAILVDDSATVDFTGDGSAGAHLTAAVKAGSVGIVTGNTGSVTFAGAGTAGSPLTAAAIEQKQPYAAFRGDGDVAITGAYKKFPMATVVEAGNGIRLVNGSAVVDVAGAYYVRGDIAFNTNEAAGAIAVFYGSLYINGVGAAGYSTRGCSTSTGHCAPAMIRKLQAGDVIDVWGYAGGYGASPVMAAGTLDLHRIGPA